MKLHQVSYVFQSQRRFFGGSNLSAGKPVCRLRKALIVSIAEAILWGEQRRQRIIRLRPPNYEVSIAEAILWGEQHSEFEKDDREYGACFNRRGDSLGGATALRHQSASTLIWPVSIAEAILWGEQPEYCGCSGGAWQVSIAEAILWGEQLKGRKMGVTV